MNPSQIWHNPRCSKSRQALALLTESGVQVEIVKYLETAPDTKQIKQVLKLLGVPPRDLMRKNETVYKELNLKDPGLTDDAVIDAMVKTPILIERPVFLYQGQAVIRRPPEKVLEILNQT
ncbi:MAG: arsenate reductase (glutaredoxin) [bacterium]